MEIIVPLFAISVGIIVPLSAFYWQYLESKQKYKTIVEMSKNIDDSSKLNQLLYMLDQRKKEPVDYRRGGVVTVFTGIGLGLFGYISLGSFFIGVGYLVGAIGLGSLIAGYLYPNTRTKLNKLNDASL